MIPAVWRFAISFVALSGAFGAYQWLAVPLIEPPSRKVRTIIDPEALRRSGGPKRDLSAFFPAGSWQLNEPKVLETGKGMLLFRKFHRLSEDRIQLTPCCLILFSQTGKRDSKNPQRPIILRAPKGAILNTEGGDTASGPSVTNIIGGRLIGEVVIEGPPSRPGAGDGLYMKTRTVQFSRDRVGTRNAIDFRYGPHYGSGRDLTIYLSAENKVRRRVAQPLFASGVHKMELVHVDQVHLAMDAKLLSGLKAQQGGGSPTEKIEQKTAELKTADPKAAKKKTPAVVTCKGSFVFDLPTRTARFEDNVAVTMPREKGPPDQILCPSYLAIEFAAPKRIPDADRKNRLPSKLKPKRIVGVGQPVRLIARSAETQIAAGKVTFLPETNTAYLEDKDAVVVRHLGYRIRSPRVRYTLHKNPKRLGNLVASGPGELEGLRKTKKESQRITAKWSGELTIQREKGQPVMSLKGGAFATVEGMGNFAADRLFAWMSEVPKTVKPSAGSANRRPERTRLPRVQIGPGAKRPSPDAELKIQVDRIAAVGRVEFDSARLRGKTNKLEAWIRHEREAPGPNGESPGRPTKATPGGPRKSVSERLSGDSQDPRKKVKKYDLAGRVIQLQVVKIGQRPPDIVDVSIQGDVRVVELGLDPSTGQPLTVFGTAVQMSRASNGPGQPPADYGALQIRGTPARISIRGATIVGREIRLDQPTNRMWIDGAGEMFIPMQPKPGRDRSGQAPVPPMHLTWEGGMQFNGGRATIFNNVQAKGVHVLKQGGHSRYLLVGSKLDITMDRFIDFRAALESKSRRAKIAPNNLIFTGGVFAQGEGYDELGRRASTDLMQVETMTLNTKSEAVRATGPGWVSTVRLEGDSFSSLKKSTPRRAEPPGRRRKSNQLIYLRVDFQRGLEGNYGTKQVQFLNNVRTIYGPVTSWNAAIDPNRPGGLGDDDVLLKCNRLLVVQQSFQKSQWFEMTASENAWIESNAFRAQAEKLTYTQLKDRLVLEGARDFAQLWLTRSMSANPDLVARKVTYWPDTNQVKSEDTRMINFHNFHGVLE